MRLLEVGARVSVEVSATSANLGPGFDCFGLALDWRERVDVEVTASGVSVDVTGEGSEVLPRDETHLVVRCLTEGLDGLGARAPGLALRGHNTIPHGRGWARRPRRSSPGSSRPARWPGPTRTGAGCCGTPTASRATPTTSPRRSTAAS